MVYTTFHHPMTQANVVTTEYADWATSCPEYKVTAVQVSPSNGPTEWQEAYEVQAMHSRLPADGQRRCKRAARPASPRSGRQRLSAPGGRHLAAVSSGRTTM